MSNIKFSSIYVPNGDVAIEKDSLLYWMKSIDNVYPFKYVNADIAMNDLEDAAIRLGGYGIKFSPIKMNDFIGQRDYYKIKNNQRVFQDTKVDTTIVFTDIDTMVVKPVKFFELKRDWDIAFTVRHPWINEFHPINLGTFFVNKRKDNKHKLQGFLNSWSYDVECERDTAGSKYFYKYINLPQIEPHQEFMMDRIVQQDYICALAYYEDWAVGEINEWQGLNVLLLDQRYNYCWKFNDKIDPQTYIYHFKGTQQSKTDRAEVIFNHYFNSKS